jgi:hypothetical protein
MAKKQTPKKQRKQLKRQAVQAVRRRTGWKPPSGTVIYADKY